LSYVALFAIAGCAAHHQARGLVLHVDPASPSLTISHDPIPGYMDAMAMPFAVADPALLADVRNGDRVAFRITVRGGRATVDRLTLLSAKPTDPGALMSPAAPALVEIGGAVGDLTMTDHRGASISLSSLRGKVVLLSFIYTRCPLADYCPRVVANLRAVADRFADRVGRDFVLLVISFDPKYDTVERLGSYARAYEVDRAGWHFVTGSPEQISRACAMFGIEFWPEQGLITHTLQTALIDRDGRLAARVEGRDYSARQLIDLVGTALALPRPEGQMGKQVSTAPDIETDSLRYLDANAVECPCPAGRLQGLNVVSRDDESIGVINGVLIEPETRMLRYYVVEPARLFNRRRYLVSADTPAVILSEDHALRVDVPLESIERQRFDSRSVQKFSDDDLLTAMFSRSAS
jgi:protein SCO1/2